MDYQNLSTQEVNAPVSRFWKTIEIWMNNPHLVNRRVLSSVTIARGCLKLNDQDFLNEILNITADELLLTQNRFNIEASISPVDEIDSAATEVLMRKLFPRDELNFSTTIELFVINKSKNSVVCFSKELNNEKRSLGFPRAYKIDYNNGKITISSKTNELPEENSIEAAINYLKQKLFPRLIKWLESDHKKDSIVEGSLNLVSAEKYTNLYNNLKKKYGTELVKNWPECTDPAKFVYEDIAIATYLLLLWEDEREKLYLESKQSFVDLGCGNGLLVHILTSEGHSGTGIDLRRRKIWDLFAEASLEERTIIPSSKSLFPDTDWLIGNHSDELTPWIPVISARSSYKCRFFLLPCCAHEFDGRKFQRDSAASSQYSEYLKYIKTVCEGCGFDTKIDKLRIPSTKRICLIGFGRTYLESEIEAQNRKIDEIINARSLKPEHGENNEENGELKSEDWAKDFKPREVVEKVRNCTQINKSVINEIISLVSEELLRKNRQIVVENENNRLGSDEKTWNAGGIVELSDLAKIVPSDTLKELKNECGGLQTLLRNNSHIFQVINGAVQFKVPGSEAKIKKKKPRRSNILFKVKPCWFFNNHPDGCPLNDEKCTFKHEKIDENSEKNHVNDCKTNCEYICKTNETIN